VTAKHQIARLWTDAPVTVLHVGDHDPSGVHCFSSLSEDVASFADHCGGDVQFVRPAVTSEQAAFYKLPAAPRKSTDRRRFDGDETWQLRHSIRATSPTSSMALSRSGSTARHTRGSWRTRRLHGLAYLPVLERGDRALIDRFSERAIALIRRAHPGDLAD